MYKTTLKNHSLFSKNRNTNFVRLFFYTITRVIQQRVLFFKDLIYKTNKQTNSLKPLIGV